ncbi:hypothetical protein AGLY_015282 [Aphis glycines]|nr:hypothetical protein AGLY_015282 [Aphis glycines]
MFKCEQCPSEFSRKDSLTRHKKTHDKVCFPCVQCAKSFSYQSNLVRHMKNTHNRARRDITTPQVQDVQRGEIEIAPNIIVPDQPAGPSNQPQNSNNTQNQHFSEDDLCIMDEYQPVRQSVIQFAPRIAPQIQIAPQIFVPDIQAGCSNMVAEDEICMAVMDEFENEDDLCMIAMDEYEKQNAITG